MKFKCRDCGREFDIPAWFTNTPTIKYSPFANPVPFNQPCTAPPVMIITGFNSEYKTSCCPFCYSKEIEEKKDG